MKMSAMDLNLYDLLIILSALILILYLFEHIEKFFFGD
jgi:hypothetical protein